MEPEHISDALDDCRDFFAGTDREPRDVEFIDDPAACAAVYWEMMARSFADLCEALRLAKFGRSPEECAELWPSPSESYQAAPGAGKVIRASLRSQGITPPEER